MKFWLLLAGSYLLGSVPFAFLLGKSLGVDLRKVGSGNPGATNLARAVGRKWGIAGFLLDFAKGLIPVLAARGFEDVAPEALRDGAGILAGLAAILGHVFPLFLGFRGGKGVATTFGVMTALAPTATAVAGVVWGVTYLATRTVSIASIAAALALPVATWGVDGLSTRRAQLTLGFATAMAALIVWRHRSNISRLLHGTEHSFGQKKQ